MVLLAMTAFNLRHCDQRGCCAVAQSRVIVGRLTNNLFYQSIKWHEAMVVVWRSSWSGDQQQLRIKSISELKNKKTDESKK